MKEQIVNSNYEKILLIIGFSLIILDLFIISITPSSVGYEISLYSVFPTYFWLFIIGAISCGIIILVKQAFTKKKSNIWILGFFLVLFSNLVILILPLIRGYSTYGRGDVLTHLGFIQDIIATGHFGAINTVGMNLYPILHILCVTIYYFTGISPQIISLTLPIFFITFYMISIYLFARTFTNNIKQSILITAFGSILLFRSEDLMLAPSVAAFFLLPFILFVYLKAKTSGNQASKFASILLLLLIMLPFLHPGEGTLLLIIILILIDVSMLLYNITNKNLTITSSFKKLSLKNSLNVSLLLLICWFMWISNYVIFGQRISTISNWLLNEIGSTTATQYINILGNAHLTIIQFFQLVMKMYGQDILFFIVSSFIVLVVIKETLYKYLQKTLYKNNITNLKTFTFSVIFIALIILMIICFMGVLGVDFGREMRYVLFASTILNGLVLYQIFIKTNYKKALAVLVIVFLILSSAIGIFNAFPAPITDQPNSQVTQMDLSGVNWFLNNRNVSISSEAIDPGYIYRLEDSFGVQFSNHALITQTVDHFNYTNQSNYGATLNSKTDSYFLDMKISRIFYPDIFPGYQNQWKYTSNDFNRLDNNDSSVNQIYSNGQFWVYYVNYK